jgi:hypothetical protein
MKVQTNFTKHCGLSLLLIILNITYAQAQRKTDLADLQFTENVTTLLKGIPFEKWKIDERTMYNAVNHKNTFNYAGIPIEPKVKLYAQNSVIFSFDIESGKTETTNRLLKALLAKYHQPTKKIRDNADVKAYYWQTPTLFVQFMSGKAGYPDVRITSFVHVATLKALNAGIDPDFKHVYDLFKSY